MRLFPPSRAFLGASNDPSPAAIVLGACLDRTESFKAGTRDGPDRIRLVSDVLETYSPSLDADLADVPLADWGNVVLGDDMESALDAVGDAMAEAAAVGLPILLGGEHTATVGAVAGMLRTHPDLVVVHVDAHTDLRDEYEGERMSHATVMRRIGDFIGLGRIAQYGIRSGTREEFEVARTCLESGPVLVMSEQVRAEIGVQPVYLSIDIDVLDPSCAPGTGCPEPGGATFPELLAFVYALRGLRVVAVDVMEVLPAMDVNDITSAAAAKIVRECALLFADPRASARGEIER